MAFNLILVTVDRIGIVAWNLVSVARYHHWKWPLFVYPLCGSCYTIIPSKGYHWIALRRTRLFKDSVLSKVRTEVSTFFSGLRRPLFLLLAAAIFPSTPFVHGRPHPLFLSSVPDAIFSFPSPDALFASPPFLPLLSLMLAAAIVGVPVDGDSVCTSSTSSFRSCPPRSSGYFAKYSSF